LKNFCDLAQLFFESTERSLMTIGSILQTSGAGPIANEPSNGSTAGPVLSPFQVQVDSGPSDRIRAALRQASAEAQNLDFFPAPGRQSVQDIVSSSIPTLDLDAIRQAASEILETTYPNGDTSRSYLLENGDRLVETETGELEYRRGEPAEVGGELRVHLNDDGSFGGTIDRVRSLDQETSTFVFERYRANQDPLLQIRTGAAATSNVTTPRDPSTNTVASQRQDHTPGVEGFGGNVAVTPWVSFLSAEAERYSRGEIRASDLSGAAGQPTATTPTDAEPGPASPRGDGPTLPSGADPLDHPAVVVADSRAFGRNLTEESAAHIIALGKTYSIPRNQVLAALKEAARAGMGERSFWERYLYNDRPPQDYLRAAQADTAAAGGADRPTLPPGADPFDHPAVVVADSRAFGPNLTEASAAYIIGLGRRDELPRGQVLAALKEAARAGMGERSFWQRYLYNN
jgi:hypothetical protein